MTQDILLQLLQEMVVTEIILDILAFLKRSIKPFKKIFCLNSEVQFGAMLVMKAN